MGKEFSNKTSSKAAIYIGVILGMAGIMLMFINDPVGWSTIGLALILFLVLRYFGDDTTVSCDEQGFKVKIVSKRKGTTVKEYAWEDVTGTYYYEYESGGEDSSISRFFQVNTAEGIAFNMEAMKSFDELIEIFNENTKHLSYKWAKIDGFQNTYIQQERMFQ
ncbi:hypothetical protein [Lederbergia graminis]|uniref:Uncharacterized protein n=1 Tax=Lederbergia graminis TaxID=735518 RepID=A0ABW0LJ32_9BACI